MTRSRKLITTLSFFVGIGILYLSVKYVTDSYLSYLGILIGCVLVCISGYSAQARMLKIEPFEDSYKKARKTYTEGKDTNLES